MIITLQSLARNTEKAAQEARDGRLGSTSRRSLRLNYNEAALWGILSLAILLSLLGLVLCIAGAWRDNIVSTIGGVLILLIGFYLSLASAREKSNLDMLSKHFKNLSDEGKEEIIGLIMQSNTGTSKDILGLIEKLLTKFTGK